MEEEVELRDYINVLIKWKWLIVWLTILSMVTAGLVSYFLIKPVYEGSAVLVTPSVGSSNNIFSQSVSPQTINTSTIISPEAISSQLSNNSFTNLIREKFSDPSISLRVSPVKGTNYINLSVGSTERNKIVDYFNEILSMVKQYNSEAYNEKLKILDSKKTVLSESLSEVNNEISSLKEEMKKLDNADNITAKLLSLQTYAAFENERNDLTQKLFDAEQSISGSHDFCYLYKPFVSPNPIKPKTMFNISVTGVSAFFLAILIAFFLEYWYADNDDEKKELKSRSN